MPDADDVLESWRFLIALTGRFLNHTTGLKDDVLLFSGEGPYLVEDLTTLLPPFIDWYTDDDLPDDQPVDLVVLGNSSFSKVAIRSSYEIRVTPPRYLPQEGFLDLLLFDHDWWNTDIAYLETSLDTHEGLQFAHSLFESSFPWPSTTVPETSRPGEVVERTQFQRETALHELGYQIVGLSRPQRQRILTQVALPQLGLREVVETIANHCRTRRAQHDGENRYANALSEWESDLELLKERYWQGPNQFYWPSTKP